MSVLYISSWVFVSSWYIPRSHLLSQGTCIFLHCLFTDGESANWCSHEKHCMEISDENNEPFFD